MKLLSKLQIPNMEGRAHYVKAKVIVHEYQDSRISVFHGPRKLVEYPVAKEKEALDRFSKKNGSVTPHVPDALSNSPFALRPPGLYEGERKPDSSIYY